MRSSGMAHHYQANYSHFLQLCTPLSLPLKLWLGLLTFLLWLSQLGSARRPSTYLAFCFREMPLCQGTPVVRC